MKTDHLVYIGLGGVAGAAVRWAVIELLPLGALDWGVLVVNTVGSLLLGMIAAMALQPERHHHPLLISAGAGFCGSLTTFSALAVSVAGELRSGSASTGLVRLVVSVAAGLLAAFVGWHLTERSVHRHGGRLPGRP